MPAHQAVTIPTVADAPNAATATLIPTTKDDKKYVDDAH
jgi:hypothetical protein